jgi:CheY-like chemotaxis protein
MILVVDDSTEIIDWLREVVEGAGYYFDAASDARSALYKLSRIYYSMALVDIILPGGENGDDLARRIKSLPLPYRETPLIAMTGGLYQNDAGELFVEVLRKPFFPKNLRDVILRCARPPTPDLHMAAGSLLA